MAAAAIARPRVARKPSRSKLNWAKTGPRAVPPARTFHPVQEIDNTRIRRIADPREIRAVMMWLLVGAMVFVGLLSVAWEQYAIVKDGYDIADLKTKRDNLTEENHTLASQAAALSEPSRITDYATASLGMTAPKQGQVVHFDTPLPPSEGEPVMARLHPYGGKP
jgi:cell division protein FtsL